MWQQYQFDDTQGSHPYFVYTPETYQVGIPVPLVVMLHGCTQTAADFATGTAMNLLAERHGFVVLYPQQAITSNYKRCWNWFLPLNQQREGGVPARIVGMVKSLQRTPTRWRIDPTRIYVAGLSAGGSMAVILGATYPDVFAAIGVHSGLGYQAAMDVKSALQAMRRGGPDPQQAGHRAYVAMGDCARVVPTIVFQGTHDRTVAPMNGDQVVQQWMQTNHLASCGMYTADFRTPTHVASGQISNGYAYRVETWHARNGEAVQAYWKIDGLGHGWSGGNSGGLHTDPRGPSASDAMYDFFMAHPIRRGDRHSFISQKIRRHHIHANAFRHRRRI
jgi:poly(hydroxyalkanoate) depolymerase family esterase